MFFVITGPADSGKPKHCQAATGNSPSQTTAQNCNTRLNFAHTCRRLTRVNGIEANKEVSEIEWGRLHEIDLSLERSTPRLCGELDGVFKRRRDGEYSWVLCKQMHAVNPPIGRPLNGQGAFVA